jgi:thiol-disulfide isomerase/thioredoxin
MNLGASASSCFGAVIYSALLFLTGCSAESIRLSDGTTVTWSAWEGRPIVLNYWAEWCAPCRLEIPELNAVYREGLSTGTVVLGVNYDGITGEELVRLSKKMNIEFPVLAVDPIGHWDYRPPDVLPATVIVGPEGNVIDVLVGPQTRESILVVIGKGTGES